MGDRFENFTTYISLAYKYIIKIKSHQMKEFGLKASHVMCLYHLGKNPNGLTSVELGTLCAEDKAGISKTLSELRNKGLVISDNEGARVYRAKHTITTKGEEVYHHINNVIDSIVDEVGDGLSQEERYSLYKSLETITNNLKIACDKLDNK